MRECKEGLIFPSRKILWYNYYIYGEIHMGFIPFNSRWKFKIFHDFFWFLTVDLGGFCTGQPEGSECERIPSFEGLNRVSPREGPVSDDSDLQQM